MDDIIQVKLDVPEGVSYLIFKGDEHVKLWTRLELLVQESETITFVNASYVRVSMLPSIPSMITVKRSESNLTIEL
jgi:hypothetical protein